MQRDTAQKAVWMKESCLSLGSSGRALPWCFRAGVAAAYGSGAFSPIRGSLWDNTRPNRWARVRRAGDLWLQPAAGTMA